MRILLKAPIEISLRIDGQIGFRSPIVDVDMLPFRWLSIFGFVTEAQLARYWGVIGALLQRYLPDTIFCFRPWTMAELGRV